MTTQSNVTDTRSDQVVGGATGEIEAILQYVTRDEPVDLWFLYESVNIAPDATATEIAEWTEAMTAHLDEVFSSVNMSHDTYTAYKLIVRWCKKLTGPDKAVAQWCVAVNLPYSVAQNALRRANADHSVHVAFCGALESKSIRWPDGVKTPTLATVKRLGSQWPPQPSVF